MPIDTSMYGMARGFDLGDAYSEGMKLNQQRDEARARKKQQEEQTQIKDAYDKSAIVDDQGNTTVDQGKLMSQLAGLNFQAARQAEQQIRQQQQQKLDLSLKHAAMGAQIAQGIETPESYRAGIEHARQAGLDVSYFEKLSFPEFMAIKPSIVAQGLSARDKLMLDSQAADRKAMREEQRFQHGIVREERRDRQDEQDMQKLSKDVAGTQELLGAVDEIEGKLGGKLEDFSTKGNKLVKNGKAVDLPGASIPGLGRVNFYSNEARDLNSAASRVFNATLKDRSGGAVTDNEMERMKQEFNAGKYNTESELIAALQRYKRQTQLVLKNREAAYNPRVVSKYTDQGGRTSQTISGGSRGGTTAGGAGGAPILKTNEIEWED